ncbi:putative transcription factor CBF/NF-Y/archaeal histone domain, histone-fold protein [Plasmopara halstedii]
MSNDEEANATSTNLQMQLQLQNQRAQMQQQQLALHAFWQHQIQDISQIDPNAYDFKTHQLPLARIKKIMKTDEDVRMISAEAPVLFAKACEMFILELSLRAWIHTEENKRRTLQRNDIAMAITKTDVFDFLIDIVPRDDIKPAKKGPVDPQAVYQQQLQQQQAAMLQQLLQTQQNGAVAGGLAWPNQQLQQQMIQQYQRMQQNAVASIGGVSASNGAIPNLSSSGNDGVGQASANSTPDGNSSTSDQLSLNQRSVDV